jgi:hypothetical protein
MGSGVSGAAFRFKYPAQGKAIVKGDAINDVTARVADRDGSGHAQTLERGASISSTDVRHNDQFENGDIRELSVIFLDLACGVGWA